MSETAKASVEDWYNEACNTFLNAASREVLAERIATAIDAAVLAKCDQIRQVLMKDPVLRGFLERKFWDAHHVDIVWRINGQDKRYEADWLKDIWYAIRHQPRADARGEEGAA